ncbi:flagellar basal body rod protein FlgF [Vibrio diazotrophicus]|uniref:flagellar basal body rod protein FlgF n=1 Tax=Vibrio diazotrophicus TaxID=685 RepID=UPI00142DEB23|nr:flagellar basal body rod protein FlgF [Vibrio diazotrophicus]NIY94053.1 flagellar basal body rod protein FlgF [Vibrio diazotrophicus]
MNPILFTAAKGAERVMLAQEVRANNLAQVNTVGFKAIMEHSTPMKVNGSGFESSTTTRTNSASNNFAHGTEIRTDRPLDVQINGTGFFALEGKQGEPEELYTRAGNFNLTPEGNLMVGDRQVLSDGGPIVVPEYQAINVSKDGVLSITPPGGGAEMEIATLKLVNPDYFDMTLDKSGLFVAKDGNTLMADPNVSVRSGYLEASNVSSLEELVSMMSLSRQYEMQVKAMATASEIDKLGNQLLKA